MLQRMRFLLFFLPVFALACGGPEQPPIVVTVPTDAGTVASSKVDASTPPPPSSAPPPPDDNKGCPKATAFSLASLTTPGRVETTPGKVIIVDFWATWCEPCKKSFPKLQELYVKYKASGLEIAEVSVDDEKGGIVGFAKTYGAKFPIGWDEGHKVADKWKPENMPSTFIVDKKCVVRHVHKGYHDGEIEEIEKEIKELL